MKSREGSEIVGSKESVMSEQQKDTPRLAEKARAAG